MPSLVGGQNTLDAQEVHRRSTDRTGWMRILTSKNLETRDDPSTRVRDVAEKPFDQTLDESPSLARTLEKTVIFFLLRHKILLLF